MELLKNSRCTACRLGAPQITAPEISALKPQVPGWEQIEEQGISKLRKVFSLPDFAQALAFTNLIGNLAEEEGHHPTLLLEWGRVTVTWWTHKIKGLHRNDFIMAAKTDDLFVLNEW